MCILTAMLPLSLENNLLSFTAPNLKSSCTRPRAGINIVVVKKEAENNNIKIQHLKKM